MLFLAKKNESLLFLTKKKTKNKRTFDFLNKNNKKTKPFLTKKQKKTKYNRIFAFRNKNKLLNKKNNEKQSLLFLTKNKKQNIREPSLFLTKKK